MQPKIIRIICALLVLTLSFSSIAIPSAHAKGETTPPKETVVAEPQPAAKVSANLKSGTYYTSQSVKLSCATKGAIIYYTTNGATPTKKSSVYTGPIKVSKSCKIRAFAAAAGCLDGSANSFSYTIKHVSAKSIKLNTSHIKIKIGQSYTLKTAFNPSTTSDKKLTYKIKNSAIASVSSSGVVKAKKGGATTITVKTANGKTASCKITVTDPKMKKHITYRQGDPKWKFSKTVAGRACYIASLAMTVNNIGISATPRTVYLKNGKATSIYTTSSCKVYKAFKIKQERALASNSPYLSKYSGGKTYLKNPSKNGVKALKEALDRNPEGVIVYFKKGSKAHAVVAAKYSGNTIYYCDSGRRVGHYIPFKSTWTYYNHKMTYANISFIVAIDRI